MSRLGKTLGLVFAVLVLVLAAGITFTIGWRPFIGPRARALTARKFGSTPARLARGEYLVRDVTDCMACHAEHDWTAHDAPVLPNTLGAGQDMNILKGLPGKVYAPNITPDPETGVGNWSDDQLARAIREGVSHDGRALFPFMPYPDFRIHVRRRPGLGHRVLAVAAAGAQAAADDRPDFPGEILDPQRAAATGRASARTRPFRLPKSAGNTW